MISLTQDEIEFIQDELKSFLQKGDVKGAVQKTIREDEGRHYNFISGNVIAFMLENGIDIFEGTDVVSATIFAHSDIESIEIPEGIREIQRSAFSGCGELTNVKLPSTLVKIGAFAFSGCPKLSSLDIPESVTSIGHACFSEDDRIKLTTPKRTTGKLKLRIPSDEVDWYKAHLKTVAEQPTVVNTPTNGISSQEMYDFLIDEMDYDDGDLGINYGESSSTALDFFTDEFNTDLEKNPNLKLDREWVEDNEYKLRDFLNGYAWGGRG